MPSPDGRFRHLSQSGGALGGDFVRQGRRLTGASHAGVEMQLGEAGPGVGLDHRLGPLHRLIGRQMLPWIGTEMIAAEDHSGGIKADARRDTLHESAEISGRHAGIAALLVDLVAGRLDQDAPVGATARADRAASITIGWAVQTDVTPAAAVSQPLADKSRKRSAHDASFLG